MSAVRAVRAARVVSEPREVACNDAEHDAVTERSSGLLLSHKNIFVNPFTPEQPR